MKCIVISDTHGMYKDLSIPEGDVLIHAGDILGRGKLEELKDFNEWLGTLPHTHKLIIAGNHDWVFERNISEARSTLTNGIYLQDESVEINGVNFYGSPWQPWFLNWAFNLQRGSEINEKWRLIPNKTDVLVTHGPPYEILDRTTDGRRVGCEELSKALERVKPKYHLFGHIHEGYGKMTLEGCTYINASINNERYKPINSPVAFEVS